MRKRYLLQGFVTVIPSLAMGSVMQRAWSTVKIVVLLD
jgi:hypothetical protein